MSKSTQLKRTISLPSEHSEYIENQVAIGKYATASEVVRAGLRALQERDEVIADWIRREVIPAYENYKVNPESAISYEESKRRIEKLIADKNA